MKTDVSSSPARRPWPRLHWPRSMAHQLGLLLLAGALATHGIGVLFLQQVGALVHPIALSQVLERHAIAYALAREMPPARAASLLDTLDPGALRVWADATAEVLPHSMQTEERQLAASLRERLTLPATTPVWVQIERIDGGPARAEMLALRNWAALQLRISVGLPDGRWLNSWQHPSGGYEWWRLLRFSLPVSILPVLLLGYIFVRRIVRPIHALVDATKAVGRGEHTSPLPVTGPREARELTVAFNAMQQKIVRFVQDRTRMLAAIGHDFRTPITSLRLQAALIDDEPLRKDMVETLADMRAMVEETLDFARDDAALERTQPVDLQSLLHTVARRYRDAGDRLVVQPPSPEIGTASPPFRGRPVALRRALSNLIDNALRHGGNVRVALSLGTLGGDVAHRIDIDDDGPGLPPDRLLKVFEPFWRGDDARNLERGQGLGLGLSIARTCVQAHGGDVVLCNRAEGGLRATIFLPI